MCWEGKRVVGGDVPAKHTGNSTSSHNGFIVTRGPSVVRFNVSNLEESEQLTESTTAWPTTRRVKSPR